MAGTRPRSKLIDVADRAGVSPATVSRVMNDNPRVDATIRARVVTAARELGYVPNGSARALRSTRTRLVGAIIPTLKHAIYATMVDGLQARLAEHHVSVILNTSEYDIGVEFEQARLLVERGAESIVLVGSAHRPETLKLLEEKRVNCVFTYTVDRLATGATIGFDNAGAGAAAAQFLLDLGHRRLAMIAGLTEGNDRAADRRDGFLRQLAAAGLDAAAVPVVEASYKPADGRMAMRTLLMAPARPTAVFCGSDILAAGALKYCLEAGVRVPEEVSILGFDNLEIAELMTPELSTLEVPALDMGRLAADYILASPKQQPALAHRELPIRLIARRTTGPAPH